MHDIKLLGTQILETHVKFDTTKNFHSKITDDSKAIKLTDMMYIHSRKCDV